MRARIAAVAVAFALAVGALHAAPNEPTIGGEERIPPVLPLAGDWNGDGVTDLGWLNTRSLDSFFLELSATNDGSPLRASRYSCYRPDVLGTGTRLLPLAGDWFGDSHADVGLFDPDRREFLLYRRATDRSGWLLTLRFQHPAGGSGGLPVAGDWNGDGRDEVGLYLEDEHRFLLLAENGPDAVVTEVALTDLPEGHWIPVAGDWGDGAGVSVVAVWNPETRELRISQGNTSGSTTVADEDYSAEGPGLLPFSGRWGQHTSIGFYDPGSAGGLSEFVLYPCDFGGDCSNLGGRHPILLPPPEDPIAASCGGSGR